MISEAQIPRPALDFSIQERATALHEINTNIQNVYEEEDTVDLQAAIMASIAAESNDNSQEEESEIDSPMFGTLFSDS